MAERYKIRVNRQIFSQIYNTDILLLEEKEEFHKTVTNAL